MEKGYRDTALAGKVKQKDTFFSITPQRYCIKSAYPLIILNGIKSIKLIGLIRIIKLRDLVKFISMSIFNSVVKYH